MSIGTVRMDGFWGALMAAESIRGCSAVLHGPGGCRMTVSGVSVQSIVRPFSIEEGPFYFTEPRIPATYLDDEDYINGADYKLSDLLSTVDAEAVLVVQSPGTSLIGDDLIVINELIHLSKPFHTGSDAGIAYLYTASATKQMGFLGRSTSSEFRSPWTDGRTRYPNWADMPAPWDWNPSSWGPAAR